MKNRIIFLTLSMTVIFGLIFIYENRPDTITLTVNGESYIYTATDIVLVPAVTEHSFDFILGEDNVFDIPISATKLPKGTLLNGLDMFSFMVAHIDGKPTLYVRSDIPATVLLESADYILLDILHNGGNGEEMAYLMALKETRPIAGFDTLAFNLNVSDNIRPELEEKLTELGEKSHTDIIFTNDFDSLVDYIPEYLWRFREEYGQTCYITLEFREYQGNDIVLHCDCVYGSLGAEGKGFVLEPTDNSWSVKKILFVSIS